MSAEAVIIDAIRVAYDPAAILLHGSRATGHAAPDSDWDIVLLVHGEIALRPMEHEGMELDIGTMPLDVDETALRSEFVASYANARLLWDGPEEAGARFLVLARRILKEGPQLDATARAYRRAYLRRRLTRAQRDTADPLICAYHLADLYPRLLRFWFDARGEWSLPPYQALPRIRHEDPAYAEELARMVDGPIEARVAAAETLAANAVARFAE